MNRMILGALLVCTLPTLTACAPDGAAAGAPDPTNALQANPRWSDAAPVPEQRTEVSVTADGSRLFLAGGFAPPLSADQRASAPRTLVAYDAASDSWETIGEIPEGVHHAGLIHLDGRLFLIGGFRETGFTPTGAVRIYDLSTGSWSDGAQMPTPRGAMAVVLHDGRIHAIGGNAAGPDALHDHGDGITDDNSVGTHEIYDPAADSWARATPMPTPRNHHAGVSLEGRIHVVGGRASGDFEMTVHEVYSPTNDRWESGPPLPTGRSGIAAVTRAGALYVFGGETFTGDARTFDDAERFDPHAGAWTTLPPMPSPRHGLGAAVIGDFIHVVSGGPRPGFSYGTAHERLSPVDTN